MPEPIETKVSIGETYGKQAVANIVLEDARFWGRPNFSGELDQFRDNSRKFTVIIPNDLADTLRSLGWNVVTKMPNTTPSPGPGFYHSVDPDAEPISSMKVKMSFKIPEDKAHLPNAIDYEKGPTVFIKQGENVEKLTSLTIGLLDRARIEKLDMELRAWNYNREEVEAGDEEPKYSARLVELVAIIRPSLVSEKHGILR